MAKRYFQFDELVSLGIGKHKPSGTMGSHSLEVVRVSESSVKIKGSIGKVVILPQNWTLGYNCGDVWAIKPAAEINNPLHKWAREHHLPFENIVRTDEPIEFGTFTKLCGASYAPSGKEIIFFGGEKKYGDEGKYIWTGGEVAYEILYSANLNGSKSSKISAIYVRSHVSDEKAADILNRKFCKGETNQKLDKLPPTWREFLELRNQISRFTFKKVLCLACGRDWFDFNYNDECEILEALRSLGDELIPEMNNLLTPILKWDKKWILNK